jgi:hypothetical protein
MFRLTSFKDFTPQKRHKTTGYCRAIHIPHRGVAAIVANLSNRLFDSTIGNAEESQKLKLGNCRWFSRQVRHSQGLNAL